MLYYPNNKLKNIGGNLVIPHAATASAWGNELNYPIRKRVRNNSTDYMCIKPHISGGGSVWSFGRWPINERCNYSGDAYKCILARTVDHTDPPPDDTAGWELDNDEPDTGNHWTDYWELLYSTACSSLPSCLALTFSGMTYCPSGDPVPDFTLILPRVQNSGTILEYQIGRKFSAEVVCDTHQITIARYVAIVSEGVWDTGVFLRTTGSSYDEFRHASTGKCKDNGLNTYSSCGGYRIFTGGSFSVEPF